MKWFKLFKINAGISIILTLFFKIRDSVSIRALACGLDPSQCSFGEFIIQFAIWFIVILAAVSVITFGAKYLLKSILKKKPKKKAEKKEKKVEAKKEPEKKAEKEPESSQEEIKVEEVKDNDPTEGFITPEELEEEPKKKVIKI